MSDETPTPATTAEHSDSALPLVTAAASILAAMIAAISLVLLVSIFMDVAALHAQVRKLSQAVEDVEETMARIKASAAPARPAVTAPQPQPRATHIDAADPANDCIIRPGSKNPLADCLR
ncbi:MAG: hypothetical protein AB1642_10705 [Pseudomonadota bacterium]